MGTITVAIVEDDPISAFDLETFIRDLGYAVAATFEGGEEAIRFFKSEHVDLALVDISLKGGISGIEVAEEVAAKGIPLIFITAFDDPKVYREAKKTYPYGYLIKPFGKLTLQSVIESCFMRAADPALTEKILPVWKEDLMMNDYFFVKSQEKLVKINRSQVQVIEADGNYCILHTRERRYAVKLSMKKILLHFSSQQFAQIHRKYIVQLQSIDCVDLNKNEVVVNDTGWPIGESFKTNFLEKVQRI
ncbi:MAG: response regulator [Lewinella sp.]|nr:response regulator [Lewinella sp.]